MRRRDLILGLGGAAILRPPATRAQQPARRRLIAYLALGSQASVGALLDTFHAALAALGYGDDKITIESRWADGHADRLPALAAAVVQLSPDVILAGQSVSAKALMQATATIPIVFAVSDDPVGAELVASLARPGGNVTGLSLAGADTVGRELQLLKAMVPSARRVVVLVNPSNYASPLVVGALQRAGPRLQTEVVVVEAGNPEAIGRVSAMIADKGADGLLVLGDGMFTSERKRIVAVAASQHLPAIYHDYIFVEDGGLMSYGGDLGDNYRHAAVFIDKILRGAKPGDLPVEEPTKFYLYINRRTAAGLGLTIPPLLEAQADKIIE